jgi:Tfp pilus assembly protein PilF
VEGTTHLIRAAYPQRAAGFGASTRRELIVHDSVVFLSLAAATLVLYGMTWFLFRSFQAHRQDLASGWAQRGRAELEQYQAAQAVASLRAALSYAPDDYDSQLLLAQALAQSGETDKANNYFLNLLAGKPGDGFLNLQLARLERQKSDSRHAIDYYRAAIFGDWRDGNGVERRREVRIELIDYLIQQKRLATARAEILIAAGNAPDTPYFDLLFGDKLAAAQDPQDALSLYFKAIADEPRNAQALARAGKLQYDRGNYLQAHELLAKALEDRADGSTPDPGLVEMERDAGRLVDLSLSRDLPARERGRHILDAARIAQARIDRCTGSSTSTLPAELQSLEARWKNAGDNPKRTLLVQNADGQDQLTQLIFDTERETETTCGPATGDDELLLRMAEALQSTQPAGGTEQP